MILLRPNISLTKTNTLEEVDLVKDQVSSTTVKFHTNKAQMLVANADDDAIKSDADNNEHIIVEKPEKSTTRPSLLVR